MVEEEGINARVGVVNWVGAVNLIGCWGYCIYDVALMPGILVLETFFFLLVFRDLE